MLLDDDIRLEAYWIWLGEGQVHGRDRDHWWQAERRVAGGTLVATCHGTVLYLDAAARQIRHAPFGAVGDKDAVITFEEDGLRLATLQPEDSVAIDRDGCLILIGADRQDAPPDYTIRHRDGFIAVEFDTGLLSAEPDGRLVANRSGMGDGERFHLVARPRQA